MNNKLAWNQKSTRYYFQLAMDVCVCMHACEWQKPNLASHRCHTLAEGIIMENDYNFISSTTYVFVNG